MKANHQKPTQMKHTDFITQCNRATTVNLHFLESKGVSLTVEESLTLGSLSFFEKGEQILNKKGVNTYLSPIGVALHDLSMGAEMFGEEEISARGKSMFKKFYPDKYDLFF